MKYQTVKLGFTTHILHEFWYIHVCRHKSGNTSKYAFQKAYLSKTTSKPIKTIQLGQNTSGGGI
jgi:hypothetical protein